MFNIPTNMKRIHICLCYMQDFHFHHPAAAIDACKARPLQWGIERLTYSIIIVLVATIAWIMAVTAFCSQKNYYHYILEKCYI